MLPVSCPGILIAHAWAVQMSGWQGAQALHAEGGAAIAYKGMMDCLVRTVKEEGVRALFKVGTQQNSCMPATYVCLHSLQRSWMTGIAALQHLASVGHAALAERIIKLRSSACRWAR